MYRADHQAVNEDDENEKVRFKHELTLDDEELENPHRRRFYAKRGNERDVDLDIYSSRPQVSL